MRRRSGVREALRPCSGPPIRFPSPLIYITRSAAVATQTRNGLRAAGLSGSHPSPATDARGTRTKSHDRQTESHDRARMSTAACTNAQSRPSDEGSNSVKWRAKSGTRVAPPPGSLNGDPSAATIEQTSNWSSTNAVFCTPATVTDLAAQRPRDPSDPATPRPRDPEASPPTAARRCRPRSRRRRPSHRRRGWSATRSRPRRRRGPP